MIEVIAQNVEPQAATRQLAAHPPPWFTQPEPDMLKVIAEAGAYYKAPARTFALLHPLKAVKWGGIFLLVGMAIQRTARRGEATRAG